MDSVRLPSLMNVISESEICDALLSRSDLSDGLTCMLVSFLQAKGMSFLENSNLLNWIQLRFSLSVKSLLGFSRTLCFM